MSTETKFTKGIWDWEHDECTSSMIQIASDVGCSICRLQSENDAYLISAAPEMYKAMQKFIDRVERGEVRSTETYNEFKKILAKARGESI
jgi:hypothetical protein